MQPLDGVPQGRPVSFLKHVLTNLNHMVRSNAKKKPIERCVVQPAKRQAITHNRFTTQFGVGNDVRGLKEFVVS